MNGTQSTMADTATRTTHGIDLTAPGGVEALLEFHRAQFGDAVMMATEGGDGGEGNGAGEGGGGEGNAQQPQVAASGANEGQEPQEPAGSQNAPENGAQGGEGGQDTPPAETAEERQAREARLVQDAEERLRASLVEAITGKKSGEGEAPTIEDLQATVEAERRAAADARAELAVYRAAARHEADPARLTDSRAFIEALQGIDVSDAAAVDTLIGDHVKANPHLLARRPAGKRSGTDIAGNGGETPRPKTLGEAVAGHYSR